MNQKVTSFRLLIGETTVGLVQQALGSMAGSVVN